MIEVNIAFLVGIDKLLFSYFYYKAQPFVFQLRDAPPGYFVPHPYHINRLFGSISGDRSKISFIEPMEVLADSGDSQYLDYPVNPDVGNVDPVRRLNIVVVVVESLRQLDTNSRTAPFFTELAQQTIRANNHYTGGNTTHFGLFSLFYGLNPVFRRHSGQ